jgi:hypothetical protein
MSSPRDQLRPIEEALTHLDQALAALTAVASAGEEVVTVDGIHHVLQGLV